ncbi:MAG: GNAT family N-acetyltransferase, partial [Gammaproteobacteria bacterium]|nr:GNAT family N-acetyltransferase [Gammaproteobacteria bacterium]
QHGFGLNRVALKDSDEPIGICGILKRDTLDDVDLGFAFLPDHRRHGYALEASRAVLEYGFRTRDLKRIVAIVSPQNTASAKLLYQLGFRLEADYQSQADREPLDLYFIDG